MFAAQLDDHVEELAHHYSRSDNVGKAIEYLGRAADQAAHRMGYAEAVDHLIASLKALEILPESRDRDRLELEAQSPLGRYLIPLKGPAAVEVRNAFDRARELCQRLGDVEQLFWVVYGLQFYYMLRVDLATARELGMQQLNSAERTGNLSMRMAAYTALGQLMFFMGEFGFAAELCERGLSLPTDLPAFPLSDIGDPRAMNLSLSALVLSVLGYPVRALERSREAIAAGERSGAHSLALALTYVAQMRLRLRDAEGALEMAQAITILSVDRGFTMWLAEATALRGEALIQLGRVEEGLEALHQGVSAYEKTGAAGGTWRLVAAQAYGSIGNPAEGVVVLARQREVIERTGLGVIEAETYLTEAELTLNNGGTGAQVEAENSLRKAIDVAQRQQARLYELRVTSALARLLALQGRREEARTMLSEIYNWFTEGFDTADLKNAKTLLDELSM